MYVFLLLLAILGLAVGLVKPSLFVRLKIASRKMIALVFGGIFLFSVIMLAVSSESPQGQSIKEQSNTGAETVNESAPPLAPKVDIPVGTYTVTSVVDGDTLKVSSGKVVRLIGIDSPENGAPYYAEAKNKLTELVLNKQIRFEKDVSETDRYGRLLWYLWVGDLFVNLEMVRQGYAVAYTYPPDVKHSEEFVAAEKEARDNKRGLWATTAPAPTSASVPPPSSGGYSVPPCASSDCDCAHFSTHAEAQWFYDNYDPTNKHKLDGSDNDGLACESLP